MIITQNKPIRKKPNHHEPTTIMRPQTGSITRHIILRGKLSLANQRNHNAASSSSILNTKPKVCIFLEVLRLLGIQIKEGKINHSKGV